LTLDANGEADLKAGSAPLDGRGPDKDCAFKQDWQVFAPNFGLVL
jgi:hypothetical protein